MEESIMVALRIKPCGGELEWKIEDNSICRVGTNERHAFDTIYSSESSNEDIYENSIKNLVDESMNGYNVAICAYGQSGAGKTHTLTGSNSFGLVHLLFNDLFSRISLDKKKYLIRVSYLEIYNEKVRDLLSNSEDLLIQEKGDIPFVPGLTEQVITCREEVEDLLFCAAENRQVGETALNERSSRSHAILRICLESNDGIGSFKSRSSIINMVDLAGSENGDATAGLSARQKEGGNINKSLLALTKVISILSDKKRCAGHVPYRDSKLTRILKPCLGGNSKTLVVCCVNPRFASETCSTLKFARQVKLVKSRPTINVGTEDGVLGKYLAEIEALKQQLENQKVETQTNDNLEDERERLKSLMKSIINEKDNAAPQMKRVNNRRMTWAPGNGKLSVSSPPSKIFRTGFAQIPEQDESDKFSEFLAKMENRNLSFDRLSEESEEKIEPFENINISNTNRMSDFSNTSVCSKEISLEKKIVEEDKQIEAISETCDAALQETQEVKELLLKLQSAAEQIDLNHERQDRLMEENGHLRNKLQELESKNKSLMKQNLDLEQKIIEDLESTSERERMRLRGEELATTIQEMKKTVTVLTCERNDAVDNVERITEQLESLQRRCSYVEEEHNKERKEYESSLVNLKDSYNELLKTEREELEKAKTLLNSIHNSDDPLSQEVLYLKEQLEIQKQESDKLHADRIEEMKQKQISVQSSLDHANETIKQYQKKVSDLEALNTVLLENDKSIAPTIPDDQLIVDREEIDKLKSQIIILQDSLAERDAINFNLNKKLEGYERSLSTFNIDLRKKTDIVIAKDKDLHKLHLAKHEIELKYSSLREELAELCNVKTDLKNALADKERLNNRIHQLNFEAANMQEKISSISFAKNKLEVDFKLLSQDYTKATKEIESIRENEFGKYEEKISKMKLLIHSLEEQLTDTQGCLKIKAHELEEEKRISQRAIRRGNELESSVRSCKDKNAILENKKLTALVQDLTNSLANVRSEKEKIISTVTRLEDILKKKNNEVENLIAEVKKLNKQKIQGIKYLKELEAEAKNCRANHHRQPLSEIQS